jgi:restriction endonuclease Mrr
MPIPDYQSLMRPLLAFASDGFEKNINDAINGALDYSWDTREQYTNAAGP